MDEDHVKIWFELLNEDMVLLLFRAFASSRFSQQRRQVVRNVVFATTMIARLMVQLLSQSRYRILE